MSQKNSKQKRKPKIAIRIFLTLFFIACSAFFLYKTFSEATITYSLMVDLSDARSELADLQNEEAYLADQKEKLQDTNYVTNYARGQYMITKDGEAVYHLPSATGSEDSADSSSN